LGGPRTTALLDRLDNAIPWSALVGPVAQLPEYRASGADATYTHDAWNRLVKVEIAGAVRSEYEHNGLNWRTVARADADPTHDGALDRERVYSYSQNWRILEVRINDTLDEDQSPDRLAQQVWGARSIDDAVLRRVSEDLTNDDPATTWERELFYLTDAIFSVAAVVNQRAALIERVRYSPYGRARHQRLGDVDGDGDTDGADEDLLLAASGSVIGEAEYVADADLNRDGQIDATDSALLQNDWGPALPAGQISAADNPIGYAGYVFNDECEIYTVRNRSYEPTLGRWLERDPAGYTDGLALYLHTRSNPTSFQDPHGLQTLEQCGCQSLQDQFDQGDIAPPQNSFCAEQAKSMYAWGCYFNPPGCSDSSDQAREDYFDNVNSWLQACENANPNLPGGDAMPICGYAAITANNQNQCVLHCQSGCAVGSNPEQACTNWCLNFHEGSPAGGWELLQNMQNPEFWDLLIQFLLDNIGDSEPPSMSAGDFVPPCQDDCP